MTDMGANRSIELQRANVCLGWKAALTAVSPVSQDTVAGGNVFMERHVSWLGSEDGRGVKVTIGVKP